MIASMIIGLIKSLVTKTLLMELFLLLVNELAKRSDNQIDDKLVDLITRAAHGELTDDDRK